MHPAKTQEQKERDSPLEASGQASLEAQARARMLRLLWGSVGCACFLAVVIFLGTSATVQELDRAVGQSALSQTRAARCATQVTTTTREARSRWLDGSREGFFNQGLLESFRSIRNALELLGQAARGGDEELPTRIERLIADIEALELQVTTWRIRSLPACSDVERKATLRSVRETLARLESRVRDVCDIPRSGARGQEPPHQGREPRPEPTGSAPSSSSGPPAGAGDGGTSMLVDLAAVAAAVEALGAEESLGALDDSRRQGLQARLESLSEAAHRALGQRPGGPSILEQVSRLSAQVVGTPRHGAGQAAAEGEEPSCLFATRRRYLEALDEREALRARLAGTLDQIDFACNSFAVEAREHAQVEAEQSSKRILFNLTLLRFLAVGAVLAFLCLSFLFARMISGQTRSLHYAREDAEAATRLKAEFLANMSHEVRTPINDVIGMTSLLLDEELTADQRQLALAARRSGEALLSLVTDVLDYSKIRSGDLEVECVPFSLLATIEETLEQLAAPAQDKGLDLVGYLPPEVPTDLRGDVGKYRQVLTNLLRNAVKFTHEGEVSVSVELASTSTESNVVLRTTVSDTGVGLSREAAERVFQPFVQADGSTTRQFGGLGLGLAICRELVERMGGEIGVESALGEGSRFWFTMKVKGHPVAQISDSALVTLSGKRVCIVDASDASRRVLTLQTQSWGMTCQAFADASRALAALGDAQGSEKPFHAAIIAYELPTRDGIELVRSIRLDPRLSSLQIILLATVANRVMRPLALEVGVNAFLLKPVRRSHLLDGLLVTLGKARDQRSSKRPPGDALEPLGFPCRVLAVEDNIVNQKVVARILERLGAHAEFAANGREAVLATRRGRYDVVLMDCAMPVMDGFDATVAIRRWEGRSRRTPIIGLTARVEGGMWERCVATGMDDCLSKPIQARDLLVVLKRWVSQRGDSGALAPAGEAAGAVPHRAGPIGQGAGRGP